MSVRKYAFILGLLFLSASCANSHAIEFTSLTCSPPSSPPGNPDQHTISCTAVIKRGGSGAWYNAPFQECSYFCRSIGGFNSLSPDGFGCTSGEERPQSAIGIINYTPTGCWHDCRFPEGRPGAISIGYRCYAPGQKRDNDRTDMTVGCFCAGGDVNSHVVDIGIHASGAALIRGASHQAVGWTSIHAAAMNDLPGRVSYIRGSIPLSGYASVNFVIAITGGCGRQLAMSGRTNGSAGTTDTSNELVIELPACQKPCTDGVDNDQDGSIDAADFSCVASNAESEHLPQAACENGRDDDGDGLFDEKDPGCASSQDTSENNDGSSCDSPGEHAGQLTTLQETIRAQRIVVYNLLDPIIRTTTDPAIKTKAKDLRRSADIIKRELVRILNKQYPKTTLQCPGCPTRNLTQITDEFIAGSRKMERLTRQASEFAQGVTPGLNTGASLQTADNLFEQFNALASALPKQTSVCAGSRG